MAAIARKAGVSVGSIYQYFSSKEDLLDALVSRVFADTRAKVQRLVDLPHPTDDDFRAMYLAFVTDFDRELPLNHYLLTHRVEASMQQSMAFQSWAEERFAELALRTGRIEDPEHATRMATSAVRAIVGLLQASARHDTAGLDIDGIADGFLVITNAFAPAAEGGPDEPA